jgi:serine/threonine protein kinase/DNA-binding winged helix-turn-helix (wHTH) protein/tetratricopeptide (TPR) repeat protein
MSTASGKLPVTAKERTAFRYRFDKVEYDEASASLRVDGQLVSLEPRPLRLLAEMLRHVNEVVTKEELFESVWDGRPTVDNVFANAVTKLRKALGEVSAKRIVNVPRIGYRFEGTVERIATNVLADGALLDFKPGQVVQGRENVTLVKALGSSGRGNVWLARNTKMETLRVFKFAADADQLRQLKREFTLCRVLQRELGDRSEFVRLIDSNFRLPPFFIESEYGGTDLLAWSTESKHLGAMSPSERLSLFLQIARAVAAAHSVGVLHKDIKPSNILISGEPGAWVAKLADFGSGRAMDLDRLRELGLTAIGLTLTEGASSDSFSGTAMYLAPEVLAGGVPSTQSDVYALGLVLFQMLAGDMRRPMSSGWQRDVGDALLRDDIATATDGAPSARLGSVAELVERVARLDSRRAEAARLHEVAELLSQAKASAQRRRLRRPWQWAAAFSLSVGLVASLALYWHADQARILATNESNRAALVIAFLNKDVLESADATRTAHGKPLSMQDVLKRASARAEVRFKGQPEVEALIHRQLGDIELRAPASAFAVEEFRRALKLLEPLRTPGNTELLISRFGLAQALANYYQAKEGKEVLEQALNDGASALRTDTPALRVAAKRAELVVLMGLQKDAEAVTVATDLLAQLDRWADAELADRFGVRARLAELYIRLNENDKAQALLTELAEPPFGEEQIGIVTYALARISMAKNLLAQKKTAQGKALLIDVLAQLQEALGPESFQVGLVNYELGSVFVSENDEARVYKHLVAARIAFAASLGKTHGFTRSIAANLAITDVSKGRAAAGLRVLDELAPFYQTTSVGTNAIDYFRAWALNDLGRWDDALKLLGQIDAERFAWAINGESGAASKLQAERGRSLIGLGRRDEGLALIQTAIADMKKAGLDKANFAHYQKYLR